MLVRELSGGASVLPSVVATLRRRVQSAGHNASSVCGSNRTGTELATVPGAHPLQPWLLLEAGPATARRRSQRASGSAAG